MPNTGGLEVMRTLDKGGSRVASVATQQHSVSKSKVRKRSR
jgi:hypothetical protein